MPFFRLFADYSANGIVDNLDLAFFRLATQGNSQYVQYFDFNADGLLTAYDTAQVMMHRYKRVYATDTTAPTVTYTGPASGMTTRNNPTVTGWISDALSGVASAAQRVDAGPNYAMALDPANAFSFSTALPLDGSADGVHTVHVTATDRAGNVSAPFDRSFTLDTTPPVVTYTSPPNGTATHVNPTVSGQVTDALSGVALLQAQVVQECPTNAIPVDPAGSFSFTIGLALDGSADGVHTVHLPAPPMRRATYPGAFDLSFVLDTRAPLLAYMSPTDGIHTRMNPTVSGQVGDALSGVASLQGQLDAGPTFPVGIDAAGNFTFATGLSLDGSADGTHTLHLTATDHAGNPAGPFDVSFVLDTTAPVVTYTSPAPNQVLNTDPTISGQVTDAVLSTVAVLAGQIDAGPMFTVAVLDAVGNFSFPAGLPLDGSADGLHTVHLWATDQPGNVSGAYDISFVLDTTPVPMDPYLAQAVHVLSGCLRTGCYAALLAQLTSAADL